MTKKHTLVLTLRRHPSRPWGIRIAGGADLGTPIVVTRVSSENDELRKGDVIKKIDDYDSRDVRHVDAQNILQNSESVRLVVERSEPLSNLAYNRYTSQSSIVESIHSHDEAAFVSLPQESQPKVLPKSPVPPAVYSPPREYKTYSPDHFEPPREHIEEVREERYYLSQCEYIFGGPSLDAGKFVKMCSRQISEKMPGYTTTYRYTIERQPKEEESAVYWVGEQI
ncbi:GSCOCG00003303001-RA-CDS [Cotesia congregata]|nr:GSCOCG00003303001-RA-CDS [Cotesia congregata]